jgi:hypothetical protein
VEWLSAAAAAVETLAEGPQFELVTPGKFGIAISCDDVVVIEGTRNELTLLATTLLARATSLPDEDPATAHDDAYVPSAAAIQALMDEFHVEPDMAPADDFDRFVLVERSRIDNGAYMTTHPDPEDASCYYQGQEYAEDWEPVVLIDTMTGVRFDVDARITLAFSKMNQLAGKAPA